MPLHPVTNRGVSSVKQDSGLQIDWITATTQDKRIELGWFDLWLKIAQAAGGMAYTKPWKFWGYEGASCDGSRWGKSDRGCIFICIGHTAHKMWQQIAPVAHKVTRLDLAVTVALQDKFEHLPALYYKSVPKMQQRKYSLTENSWGGTTLYIGSRSSEEYGRIYDKGAQQGKQPGWIYRYELEMKAPKTSRWVRQTMTIMADPSNNDALNLALERSRGYLWQWFNNRDVPPIFDSAPTPLVLQEEYSPSTPERKLTWLRTTIKPTVKKLIKAGYLKETIEALDLEEFVAV